jgi:hypothetical protein
MTDIDRADAAPQPAPTNDEPAYSPDVPPAGLEASVNVVAEDSEEADFSKNQEPELDESNDEDEAAEDDELDLSGPATEGA